jgi:hypothetical protein
LSKHENAVLRIREEADRIKRLKEAKDEETKLQLLQAEESRAEMSETQRHAYYADWFKIQAEMTSLSEQMSTSARDDLRRELEDSSYCSDLRALGLQDQIEAEVQRAMTREQLRQERAVQRLNRVEEMQSEIKVPFKSRSKKSRSGRCSSATSSELDEVE